MTEAITQDSNTHQPVEGQRSQQKKWELIKRIFKCFGLGLLVLLIIAALIFGAPWKVITLLLVILAACTVLPKWARKWFWLSAGVAVLMLIIWVFLPEDNKGWRPYTFNEELAALQAKYAVPDEENAAVIYDKLFEEMDGDANEPEFFLQSSPSSKDEPWLSKDHPETAEWLKGQQDKISILLQAAKKDKCYFTIYADPWSFGQYMERLPKIRRCAFLLVSAGNNDIAEGRIGTGLEKYFCIIGIADHLYQQPAMIDLLVGFAIESLASTQLNRFVIESQPNGEQLEVIADSIKGQENNWESDFIGVLEYEKLFAKNTFCSTAYQVNPQGKVRLSRDPYAGMKEEWQEEVKASEIQDPEQLAAVQRMLHPTYWQRKLLKANTILSWFFMPSTPQEAGEIIDARFEKHYAMAERGFDWSKHPHESPSVLGKTNCDRLMFDFKYFARVTADMLEESYHRVHDIYLRNLALRRGSRLLVAVRQYKNEKGSWPANLDAVKSLAPAECLIDPINDDSFIYKLTDDNFKLYSKGKNNIDEAGEYETEWADDYIGYKVKEDDWLIWPPKSRKTKKENIDAEQQ